MSHYTHFTIDEREQSRAFQSQGLSIRAIARILNRSAVNSVGIHIQTVHMLRFMPKSYIGRGVKTVANHTC